LAREQAACANYARRLEEYGTPIEEKDDSPHVEVPTPAWVGKGLESTTERAQFTDINDLGCEIVGMDPEGEASDGFDRVYQAEHDYGTICAELTGVIVPEDVYAKSRERRERMDAQTVDLGRRTGTAGLSKPMRAGRRPKEGSGYSPTTFCPDAREARDSNIDGTR
ncbi:MAG: hypothetical protein LBK99_03010, partial [Opitutaceae bacterium]|nr:hypothetical protein [Opitutaceae bacterium]